MSFCTLRVRWPLDKRRRYRRIRDYIVHLGHRIGEATVKNIVLENGYDPEPNLTGRRTWKEFIKSHCNVPAACDFFSIGLLSKGKLIRCPVLFAIDLSTRKVEILGVRPQLNDPWMKQIARNLTCEDSFLAGKRYLIHDRDPLYTAKFDSILNAAGVDPVKLPARSPNLNAHAERFSGPSKKKMSQPSDPLIRRATALCIVRVLGILSS